MEFINKIKILLSETLSSAKGYSKVTICLMLIGILSLICMLIFK